MERGLAKRKAYIMMVLLEKGNDIELLLFDAGPDDDVEVTQDLRLGRQVPDRSRVGSGSRHGARGPQGAQGAMVTGGARYDV